MESFRIVAEHDVATVYQNGKKVTDRFEGRSNAEAIGHALFWLSCVCNLEGGVKLDLVNGD